MRRSAEPRARFPVHPRGYQKYPPRIVASDSGSSVSDARGPSYELRVRTSAATRIRALRESIIMSTGRAIPMSVEAFRDTGTFITGCTYAYGV
jgi:hypothetical protein